MEINCCPPLSLSACTPGVRTTRVCLLLKPGLSSKIAAIRTSSIDAGCVETISYSAVVAGYNPLAGYTAQDEIACGDGRDVPYDNPTITGGGADRELVVTTYYAKNAFSGASVGDMITATQVIDVSGTPSTVSTIWRNQTTATDLGAAPVITNLQLFNSTARQLVEPLGTPGVARSIPTSGASASVALTSTCLRISLYAKTADIRFRIGSGAQTAVATDHFIALGERVDFAVAAGSTIAAIQDSAAGVLLITELV